MKIEDLRPKEEFFLLKPVKGIGGFRSPLEGLTPDMRCKIIEFSRNGAFAFISCPQLVEYPIAINVLRECRLINNRKRYRKHRRKYVQK